MPRTAEQNRQLRAASEERILRAARATFARHGYDGASVRAIAETAGVAPGLMYNYFGSKDDLLRAVFREGARDVAAALAPAEDDCTPQHQLELFIRRSFWILAEHLDFWKLSYLLRFDPRSQELLGPDIQLWTADVRAQFEGLLRAIGHRDASSLAYVLFGAIDGIAQHYALDPRHYALDEAVDALVRHFCSVPRAPVKSPGSRRKSS